MLFLLQFYIVKKLVFLFITSFVFIFSAQNIFAQKIKSMEFQNQEITDILLALADMADVSIIPDETVTGKASFYFSESEFEDALSHFLESYRLFFTKENNIYKVSRISSSWNEESQTASIKADDTKLELIIRNLSKAIGKTILYDTLPYQTISIDAVNLPVKDILVILTKKYSDYQIETADSYYYIKKIEPSYNEYGEREHYNTGDVITRDGELYSLNLEKGRFFETLTEFFSLAEKEYSLLTNNDIQLENLYFTNKDFATMLKLILEHGNADYVEKNDIFYILEIQRRDVIKKLKDSEFITLKYLQAQDIMSLLPSELASGSVIKADKNNNAVILTGTTEEIFPIKQFISKIDIPQDSIITKRIDLKYISAKDVISVIPQKMIQNTPVFLPESNSLLVSGTKEKIAELETFFESIDKKKSGIPIKLKYIQTSELLEKLPPAITKDDISESGFPNILFYTGTAENLKLFQHELNIIDRPKPQIKYQILVIQYDKNKSAYVKPSTSVKPTENSGNFSFVGDLTNLLSLSFDIISQFGYDFALKLNSQITENSANIFTDTTLTALSGQEIKFQNTDTYRYIEYEIDTSSGVSKQTGVTQQITSGLIVSLNGWVSGDDMITMSVNATVSKQNSNSASSGSTSLSSLPSTSERVVNTQVRTYSGKPVVISGLIKEDAGVTEQKVPLLGSIPGIGNLFKHKTTSKEKTEIVIYIVPHLIKDSNDTNDTNLKLERYYNLVSENSLQK